MRSSEPPPPRVSQQVTSWGSCSTGFFIFSNPMTHPQPQNLASGSGFIE